MRAVVPLRGEGQGDEVDAEMVFFVYAEPFCGAGFCRVTCLTSLSGCPVLSDNADFHWNCSVKSFGSGKLKLHWK